MLFFTEIWLFFLNISCGFQTDVGALDPGNREWVNASLGYLFRICCHADPGVRRRVRVIAARERVLVIETIPIYNRSI